MLTLINQETLHIAYLNIHALETLRKATPNNKQQFISDTRHTFPLTKKEIINNTN